jgi:ankyrin repeat protein
MIISIMLHNNTKMSSTFLDTIKNYSGNIGEFKAIISNYLEEYPKLVHEKDRSGLTILHIICKYPNLEDLVAHVLKLGADVNANSSVLGTPLHVACVYSDNIALIKQLIDAGADVNAISAYNSSKPLDNAYKSKSKKVMELLVTHGAESTWTGDYNTDCLVRTMYFENMLLSHKVNNLENNILDLTDKLQVMIDYLSVLIPPKTM